MLKITQTDPPASTPNPFAFDPDTRAGEFVQCVVEDAINITHRKIYEVRSVTRDGPYVRNDDGQYHVYLSDCFQNIHRIPDGRWVLGRDPALVKAKEPKVWTLGEIREKGVAGDVFGRAVKVTDAGDYRYAVRLAGTVVFQRVDGHHSVMPTGQLCQADRWHYLGNHTLELKVGGPEKHPSEGE
jgi:hypothetical protein